MKVKYIFFKPLDPLFCISYEQMSLIESHGQISIHPFNKIKINVLCYATANTTLKNEYTNYQELYTGAIVHYKVRD